MAYNRRICARAVGRVVIVSVLVIGSLVVAVDGLSGLYSALSGAIVGGLFFLFHLYVLVPRQARGIYREQRSMAEPRVLSIDLDKAEFVQASGAYKIAWNDVIKWDETPRLVTLYVSRAMFIPITKSDVGEDMTKKIIFLLRESGLTKAMRQRSK